MFCQNCGQEMPDSAEMCGSCGKPLRDPAGEEQPGSAPAKTSGLAIASLVLGILGLLTCGLTAIVGLVLGIVALVKIGKSRGRLGGQGLAIAGTCISGLMMLLIVVQVGLLLPALSSARERARRSKCSSNAKQITYGLMLYSGDNDERFPASLDELRPDYISDREIFVCPSNPDGGYVYVKGLSASDSPECVLVYDAAGNHDGAGRNVAFIGGHVQWMTEPQFTEALARTKQYMLTRGAGGGGF
ncbi:MAG: DUF4190 domain-containing protein [Planctomycetota bacterium]|jgi:prepilin-type processing-associated H-X9-DG protein